MIQLTKTPNNPNEFYLGGLPGQLQYSKSQDEFINLNTDIDVISNDDGWYFAPHTKENLMKLTPNTPGGKKNWKILVIIEKVYNDITLLKGALLNRDTNEIALLTTIDNKDFIISQNNRPIHSCYDKWFIGHYRMTAPLIFWKEIKNRLQY